MEGEHKRENRIKGFLLGALVADAASQPLHWLYDEAKLASAIEGHEQAPEFISPTRNPFYTAATGETSCYGDQVLVVLESLAAQEGKLDMGDLSDRFYKSFGPGTVYDIADRKDLPIKGKWRTFSVGKFCESHEAGRRYPETVGTPDDEQSDCAVRLVPLVAAYAGKDDLLDRAEDVIRLTQTSEVVIAFGLAVARLYEKFVLADGPLNGEQVLRDLVVELQNPSRKNPQVSDAQVVEFLEKTLAAKDRPYNDYQKELGLGCSLKMGVPGTAHLLLTVATSATTPLTTESFSETIRTLLKRGGDIASRAIIVGSLLGSQVGAEGLPKEWTEKTTAFAQAKGLADKLVASL